MKNEHKKQNNKNKNYKSKEESVNPNKENATANENVEDTTTVDEDLSELDYTDELEDDMMDEEDMEDTSMSNAVEDKVHVTKKTDFNKTKSEKVGNPFSKPKMNKRNTAILMAVLLLALLGGLGYYFMDYVVAAQVNGKPISRLALWMELEKQYGTEMLDSLVTKELVMQEGKKNNIVVTDAEIDAEIATISENIVAQGSTLDEALLQANLTLPALRENIVFQKTLEKLASPNSTVTDEELEQALTQFADPETEVTEEMRAQVKAELIQQKNNQALQMMLTKLKETATIEISEKL